MRRRCRADVIIVVRAAGRRFVRDGAPRRGFGRPNLEPILAVVGKPNEVVAHREARGVVPALGKRQGVRVAVGRCARGIRFRTVAETRVRIEIALDVLERVVLAGFERVSIPRAGIAEAEVTADE